MHLQVKKVKKSKKAFIRKKIGKKWQNKIHPSS